MLASAAAGLAFLRAYAVFLSALLVLFLIYDRLRPHCPYCRGGDFAYAGQREESDLYYCFGCERLFTEEERRR
jgi:hypothetical protein